MLALIEGKKIQNPQLVGCQFGSFQHEQHSQPARNAASTPRLSINELSENVIITVTGPYQTSPGFTLFLLKPTPQVL